MQNKDKAKEMTKNILGESLRTLKSDGIYAQVTDEDPDLRMALIQELLPKEINNYSVNYKIIYGSQDSEYFMYLI